MMELDDLKNDWDNISSRLTHKQNVNTEMIDQMTKTKYQRGIRKIIRPEITGVIVCLAGALFILVNFSKLDTVFLQATGIIATLVLFILSAISIISLKQFKIDEDMNKPYAETLKTFARGKINFLRLQRINIFLSYLLLVTVIILCSKFFGKVDIVDNKYFWIYSFSFGYIFLLFYSRWVSKKYGKVLSQAEELLKELNA